jgi:aryl-alcohol dehydrogenase-like predicted oxidoreductase
MINKIELGSAQWGSAYGVSNTIGKTNYREISDILSIAYSNGIRIIDTAPIYGDLKNSISEQNLKKFELITKTPKFCKSIINQQDITELKSSFCNSLNTFKKSQFYGALVHHAPDLLAEGGKYIADALNDFKEKGKLKKIGVSIYDSKNLDIICDRLRPDIIQLPINVIDQRFIKDGTIQYLKKKGIEIHARSIFLQGLLLMPHLSMPAYFNQWKNILSTWQKACHDQNFNFLQAALNFVFNIKEIDYYLIGFENSTQLSECISNLNFKKKFDANDLNCFDVDLINPTNWKLY